MEPVHCRPLPGGACVAPLRRAQPDPAERTAGPHVLHKIKNRARVPVLWPRAYKKKTKQIYIYIYIYIYKYIFIWICILWPCAAPRATHRSQSRFPRVSGAAGPHRTGIYYIVYFAIQNHGMDKALIHAVVFRAYSYPLLFKTPIP